MNIIRSINKHGRTLRSSIRAVRGSLGKSIPTLQRARSIDYENFKAVRTVMQLQKRDRTTMDRFFSGINLLADCKPEAEPIIRKLLSESESQLCQDIFCMLAHAEKRQGYFVEIGVGAGRSISNTYLLENKYDWRGLLIEPCRSFHQSIREIRRATLDSRAASSKDGGEVTFHEALANGEYSYAENALAADGKAPSKKNTTAYKVQTATLNRIFEEHGVPKAIDFISLDTEGSELDILDGLDLRAFQVGVFCIEHNHRQGFVEQIDKRLAPFEYRRVLPVTSAYDAWYIHNSIKSRFI